MKNRHDLNFYGTGKENGRHRQMIMQLQYNMLKVIIGKILHFKRAYRGCVTQIQKEEMLGEDFWKSFWKKTYFF